MSDVNAGVLAGLVCSVTYALASVGYQSQIKESNSFIVNCIKTWAAVPVMISAMLILGSASLLSVPIPAAISFVLSMFAGVLAADTFYLTAQERIGVSYALPISMTYPIFTYTLAMIICWEPLIVSRLLGIVLAVVGVVVLSREQSSIGNNNMGLRSVDKTGLFFAVMTSALYALSALFIEAGVQDVDPVTGATIRIISGSFVMAPLGLLAKAKGMKIPLRRPAALLAIFGMLGMGVATIFWVIAIKYVGAVMTSVIGTTASLFGVPVSVFLLKERLTWKAGLSIAATILGVVLVVLGV
ncbi:MAG: EamA family transporter [Candidatus Thorarchaeota archaeon]|jgi:drug/metabolite transporter (DMT)-like permease